MIRRTVKICQFYNYVKLVMTSVDLAVTFKGVTDPQKTSSNTIYIKTLLGYFWRYIQNKN